MAKRPTSGRGGGAKVPKASAASKPTKRLTTVQRSEREAQKRGLKKLRELGLFSGNINKPSDYAKRKLRTYEPVISGKARLVATPSAKDAKSYKGLVTSGGRIRQEGKNLIVPKVKGEKVQWNAKTGKLEGVSTRRGAKGSKASRTRKEFIKATDKNINKFRGRRDVTFVLPKYQGGQLVEYRYRATEEPAGQDIDALLLELHGYEKRRPTSPSGRRWKNIRDFVYVEFY